MLLLPEPEWIGCGHGEMAAPVDAIDAYFVQLSAANPQLKIANPSELGRNSVERAAAFLKLLAGPFGPEVAKHAAIEAPSQAVEAAAMPGGVDGLIQPLCQEAFAVKMLGALRREIIFSRDQKERGREPCASGIPFIVTSLTWENGGNGRPHQDTAVGETLLGEMSDVSRVLFPPDANTAVEAFRRIYWGRGQVGCIIVPEQPVPITFGGTETCALFENGAAIVKGDALGAAVQFVAIGAYQLGEALKAAARLAECKIATSVAAVAEPGRLREPRDKLEGEFTASDHVIADLFPAGQPRVVLTHTRPEVMTGILRRIDSGPARMRVLGYRNHAGAPSVDNMLFANGSSWAHAVFAAARVLDTDPARFLETKEILAVMGRGNPDDVMGSPRAAKSSI